MLSLALAFLLLAAHPGAEGGYVAFSPQLPAGTRCLIDVQLLHPTQIAVGLYEIRLRAERVRRMKPNKQERYLRDKEVPVVIGPGGVPFILDHHHLARLLLDTGLRSRAYAVVRANWNALPPDEFWKRMQENHWVYPYDENGKGPLPPTALPKTVGELKDDPYRSLAWLVRERGGFAKTPAPFAEFRWADFFRSRIPATALVHWEAAVETALKLAAHPDARTLPGSTKTLIPEDQRE
jgi:hypothetical protein